MQDLINELKSELSGHFEDVVLGLLMKPREFDAFILRSAIKVRTSVCLSVCLSVRLCVCMKGERGRHHCSLSG